jgi:protein SCO1/2
MRSVGRPAAAILALLLLSVLPAYAHDTHAPAFDQQQALAYSQQAIGRQVTGQTFTDADGRTLQLSALRGRPVVLNMIYTGCEDICPLIIERVADAVAAADKALGAGRFSVLTIGFDTRADTPARMRAYRTAHRISRPAWWLVSGDAGSVARLAADTGFLYAPRAGGFDHLSQTTILDSDRRVFRQIYGSDFAIPTLVEPLQQLVLGRPGNAGLTLSALTDRVRLLCSIYDPATGRYRFSYAIFIGLIVGAVSLGAVAAAIIRMWRGRVREPERSEI